MGSGYQEDGFKGRNSGPGFGMAEMLETEPQLMGMVGRESQQTLLGG